LTGHFYAPAPVFFGQSAWNRLSDEQKEIVRTAAAEARTYQRDRIDEQNTAFVASLKENGMEVVEVDKALWFDALQPVYQQFESTVGADNIKAVQDLINAGQ
jgi:TRAP-type C4-dicarboxylate transport system substrate-binding protein